MYQKEKMLMILTMAYLAFPERNDALIGPNAVNVKVDVSGSMGLLMDNGKCVPTEPNVTLSPDEKYDWCSNWVRSDDEHPWISYSISNKAMKLVGYSVRNGCCYYDCCCIPETGELFDGECCCEIVEFSLQGSNDNHTWKVIHQTERDQGRLHHCESKTFEFPMTESFKFVRFVLDKQLSGCPRCMQINQIEFYGSTISSYPDQYDNEENEESVSIIGKIKRY